MCEGCQRGFSDIQGLDAHIHPWSLCSAQLNEKNEKVEEWVPWKESFPRGVKEISKLMGKRRKSQDDHQATKQLVRQQIVQIGAGGQRTSGGMSLRKSETEWECVWIL